MNDRSRPKAAPDDDETTSVPANSDGDGSTISVDLLRRLDAALRLPPLACGRRDPLDLRPRDGRR